MAGNENLTRLTYELIARIELKNLHAVNTRNDAEGIAADNKSNEERLEAIAAELWGMTSNQATAE